MFIPNSIPLLEFDSTRKSVINPEDLAHKHPRLPTRCVMCFFQDVIQTLVANGLATEVGMLGSEIGPNPIYQLEFQEMPIAFVHAGLGAPLSGAFLEELISYGCDKIIACGGAGVIETKSNMGSIYLPTGAIRDEGLSYHYLPADQPAEAHPAAISAIQACLDTHGIPFKTGLTWTTDAIYRETRAKVDRRREQGCLTVEMEAAAFFAIAQFRDVIFGQILYGGDDVAAETWDNRSWQKATSLREKLFWLAVESVANL